MACIFKAFIGKMGSRDVMRAIAPNSVNCVWFAGAESLTVGIVDTASETAGDSPAAEGLLWR